MSAAADARLDTPATGKRKRDVPALWETTLGTVLSNLSAEHTDQFVKSVLGDSVLRERFTEELLRRARHVPDLGDSDLMEFVRLCPAHERESKRAREKNEIEYKSTIQLQSTHCMHSCERMPRAQSD